MSPLRLSYDALGNITTVSLKENAQSPASVPLYTKTYDERGNLQTKADPSAQVTDYSYNSLGLGTRTVDRNGSTLTAAYDGMNRLISATQTSQDGTTSLGCQYNYSSPFGFDEERMYQNDSAAPVTENTYTYDALGQITGKETTGSGYLGSGLELQYDDAGRLTNIGAGIQGSTFHSRYQYTKDRLAKVQTNGSDIVSFSDTDNATYEYYPDGKLYKITYPRLNDGTLLTTEYLYNALGRLITMINKKASTVLSRYTYTYDANGNITTVNNGQTTTYTYDKLNRLVRILPQTGTETSYTYDLKGNRRTENNDNFTGLINTEYTYQVDNKLNSVTKGTTTATMNYYADGMRAKKTTATGTTHYIYNLAGKLIAEADGSNTVTANYVWGPDRALVKKETGGGEYYYLYNGHGDVIQIVDRNGNVVNNYKYDEWGTILESNETVSNPFKYAGEVYDEETGLYYLRARYYDPALGRFINEDTYEGQINNPLTLNVYTYCANNPIIYVDPSGHAIQTLDAGGGEYIFLGGFYYDPLIIGTGKVGDFSNISGVSIEEVLSRVPSNAENIGFKPTTRISSGFQYEWTDSNGYTYTLRVHSSDSGAPLGSNSQQGWTARIIRSSSNGKIEYMNDKGKWVSDGKYANDTHIPIKEPQKKDNNDKNPPTSGGGGLGDRDQATMDPRSNMHGRIYMIIPLPSNILELFIPEITYTTQLILQYQ